MTNLHKAHLGYSTAVSANFLESSSQRAGNPPRGPEAGREQLHPLAPLKRGSGPDTLPEGILLSLCCGLEMVWEREGAMALCPS